MNPNENNQKWFFEEGKVYPPNPSEGNEREYTKIEKAINSPGTDDLDENTKDFVLRARMKKNRMLAERKRKILQELKQEPLSVENNNNQRLLAAMFEGYVEPRQYYRNENLLQPLLYQQILERESESSGQREVNIPPKPPDKNAQQSSLAEEQGNESENPLKPYGEIAEQFCSVEVQEIESHNPLESCGETPEHSSSAEVQEIDSGNPLESYDETPEQSSSAKLQEIESSNPLDHFGGNTGQSFCAKEQKIESQNLLESDENAEQSSSAKEQEIESENPLEPFGETPEHSSSAEVQDIKSQNPLEPFGENAEQSFSAEEQKIESLNSFELFNGNIERFFSPKKQKIESKNPSKPCKKAEQSSRAKKPRIESENALKPPGENAKQSISAKKLKIESETPLTELSLNQKSPTITAPQSHSTPLALGVRAKNNTKVPNTPDSALGNEIEDSVDESSGLDTSLPGNKALGEDSSAVVEPVQKNEGELEFSDSGVAESNVAGQDSTKRFR